LSRLSAAGAKGAKTRSISTGGLPGFEAGGVGLGEDTDPPPKNVLPPKPTVDERGVGLGEDTGGLPKIPPSPSGFVVADENGVGLGEDADTPPNRLLRPAGFVVVDEVKGVAGSGGLFKRPKEEVRFGVGVALEREGA
jgi:hypothetical protein